MSLSDDVNSQLDGRKIDQLIADGVITPEEVLNAPVVLECGNCGLEQSIENDVCENADCKEVLL